MHITAAAARKVWPLSEGGCNDDDDRLGSAGEPSITVPGCAPGFPAPTECRLLAPEFIVPSGGRRAKVC